VLEHSDAAATVRAYKSLSGAEHAVRSLKTVDLELRPVFHWTAPRVRAHVLLCMLAYYLQWHMRRSLARCCSTSPIRPRARRSVPRRWPRPNPHQQGNARPPANAPTQQSLPARKRGEPLPVHSFHTLLGDLATLTRNVVRLGRDRLTAILATPTGTQHRAIDLLGVTPTAQTDRRHPLLMVSMACAQKKAKFGLTFKSQEYISG
jgi:hypothetical protein